MELDARVFAALIGAMVAGTLAFAGGAVAQPREAKRRDLAWFRSKLVDYHSSCIYYLVKLSMSSLDGRQSMKDIRQHFSEAQRYLILLRTYQTDSSSADELSKCSKTLSDNWNETDKLSVAADKSIEIVKKQLEADMRILTA